MSKRGNRRRADGQLNRNQVITTYGPGAMVDLIEDSVLIGGLNHWAWGRQIHEPRLVKHLCQKLNVPRLELREPPLDNDVEEMTAPGIRAFVFPGWFVGNIDKSVKRNGKVYRTRPLFHITSVKGGKVPFEGKNISVSPMRFVQACENGHLEDINWHFFLYGGRTKDFQRNQLWLDEGGAGNDLTEVFIRGEDADPRSVGQATMPDSPILGTCRGGLPWIGYDAREDCALPSKLLIRSASNAYFSKTLTTISLPDTSSPLAKVVENQYESVLVNIDTFEKLQTMYSLAIPLLADLLKYPAEEVWKEILRYRGDEPDDEKLTLKDNEINVLLCQEDEVGGERPEDLTSDDPQPFLARNRRLDDLSPALAERIDRIVLVHRLTEVMVLVGFTRFQPDRAEINGQYERIQSPPMGPREDFQWLPAVENQGEGVFISFKPKAIQDWMARPAVAARIEKLREGFDAWRLRKDVDRPFPEPAYYMLHALSHLLITAVATECGYSSTAIKERIYANQETYGILLYTWTPSSEGTLGGLIEVGRRIERSLERALEMGALCSNDPVCAYHQPDNPHEERFLVGAACHGCLLISEPCCEQGNELLDRALVIPTVDDKDAAFFSLDEL